MKTVVSPDSKFEGSSTPMNKLTVQQDRNIATLAHFGGVIGCIPSGIILYLYRGRGPFAEQEAREAFNFTLLPSIVIVFSVLFAGTPKIGWLFGLIAALTWTYLAFMSLRAGIKVNRSNPYQYKFNTFLFERIVSLTEKKK